MFQALLGDIAKKWFIECIHDAELYKIRYQKQDMEIGKLSTAAEVLPIFTIHSTIKSYYSLESLAGNIIDSLLHQKMPNVTVPSSAIIWVIITVVLFAAAAVCFSMAANTRTKNKKRKQKLARAKVLVLVSGIICGIAYPLTLLFRMLCNVDIMVYYQSYDRLYYGGIAALIISIITGIILVIELFKIITNI